MNKLPVVLLILIMLTGCSGTIPDIGVNNGKLMSCPKTPNCVNSQATDEKHYIEPIHFMGTQHEAQGLLLQIIESEQRTKIIKIENDYIRAEFTSAFFGFTDDLEFYFPAKQGGKMVIHLRSASRIGYSDLGVNRKRIEKIRNKFRLNSKKL